MELSSLQKHAITKAKEWYKTKNKQTFSIHGFAGSGKSTIVQYLIKELGLEKNVAYVTFTGKASLVLNQKGCPALTIHRLIYEMETYVRNGVPATRFVKKTHLAAHIRLIVIDESSMVSNEILNDLLSYKIPIIAIGDPEQLPPIGEPNPLMKECDIFLDEIHRQAATNPIIQLSMLARGKKEIPYGIYSQNVAVLRKRDLRDITLLNADQVICGKNATRRDLNNKIRTMVHRQTFECPVVNDKMICLKNNWQLTAEDYPLINGMIGYVKAIKKYDKRYSTCNLDFRPDFLDATYYQSVYADLRATEGKSIDLSRKEDINFFDYGYAITCHKSQGSSFNKVVVCEEVLDPKMHSRWLYTAITRAEEKLILVR